MKERMKLISISILLAIISGLLVYLLTFLPPDFSGLLMKLFTVIVIIFIMCPIIKTNLPFILNYFQLFDNIEWDKRIERPRILIYIIYFSFLFFLLKSNTTNYYGDLLMLFRFSIIFYQLLGIYLLGYIIWSEKFRRLILPTIKSIINQDLAFKDKNTDFIDSLFDGYKEFIATDSYEDYVFFLRGEKVNSKIKWIGTSGKKAVTYTKIFELLHLMLDEGNFKLEKSKRKKLLLHIIENFVKYEDLKISEIPYGSLNGAYTNFKL